jgi:WD40 repeat protein
MIEREKYISIFDNDFNCIKELKQKEFVVPSPFANLNNAKLAYGSDGNIKICDINNNYNEYSNIEVEKDRDIYFLLSINEFNLLISGTLTNLKVWETNTFQCLYMIKNRDSYMTKLLSMPNGFIAVGLNSGEIRILDALRNKVINTLKGHSRQIISLVLTKDNKLISKCYDNNIRVWS